jgi:aspartate/methionine/tyrosine aminotransferase
MKIKPFLTEHFYAKYEFTTPYQLCNSDCETVTISELLELAGVPILQFGELALGYTETLGHPKLREQIASAYSGIDTDDVIILGSPVEGIYLIARAVLNPGDEVIVLSPAYDALINMFEHVVGAENVKRWEFIPAETHWELHDDQLKELITSKTKVLVVNFPHNPTGYLPSRTQFNDLIDIVEKNELILFCDEMYFGLVRSRIFPIPSAVELSSHAIILSGLSKSYGLPGLRTGWLILQNQELRKNIINWKFYTSICPPAPSEFLAQVAWKVRKELIKRSNTQIEKNLRLADPFFERWPDLFTWRRPMAGSTGLVGMNVNSVSEFATRLAREAGILIHPANTLGYDDHHMRMGFGRSGFCKALTRFEEYLRVTIGNGSWM